LRVAALSFRQENRDRESRVADRARRLLEAAASKEPVAPVSDEAEEMLRQFDQLGDLDRAGRFALLAEREPRLAELKAEVLSGRYGKFPEGYDGQDMWAQLGHVEQRMYELVGSRAMHPADALLRSDSVAQDAYYHLWDLMERP
jgi:hypothetical protein